MRASLPPAVRPELRHCHQLDYATSGVMLYATSKKAAAAAQICFQERRVQKEYLALVWGTPPSRELSCAEPICQSTEDAFKMMIGDVDAVWPLLDQDAYRLCGASPCMHRQSPHDLLRLGERGRRQGLVAQRPGLQHGHAETKTAGRRV